MKKKLLSEKKSKKELRKFHKKKIFQKIFKNLKKFYIVKNENLLKESTSESFLQGEITLSHKGLWSKLTGEASENW